MKKLPLQRRTLALLAVILPLAALFIYVGLRSGPLAPVAVVIHNVESKAIQPALFGIGTVETQHTYKIGPTTAGRLNSLHVDVGDTVKAGQVLGEMDAVDIDDKLHSQTARIKRAEAVLSETKARRIYAQTQSRRYEKLFAEKATSQESMLTKQHELHVATAALAAAEEELSVTQFDYSGLKTLKDNLRLVAPMDGIVLLRHADPGTTLVAGQAAIEVINPAHLWINVRFDQTTATGLAAELPAHITLRSRSDETFNGKVLRIEPKADVVTEEILAKVIFDTIPQQLPPIGELAEVVVNRPALAAAPTISNAAIRRQGEKIGVWKIVNNALVFTPIKLGQSDLAGFVQVLEGLSAGDQIVMYSEKTLSTNSRINVVEHIAGVSP